MLSHFLSAGMLCLASTSVLMAADLLIPPEPARETIPATPPAPPIPAPPAPAVRLNSPVPPASESKNARTLEPIPENTQVAPSDHTPYGVVPQTAPLTPYGPFTENGLSLPYEQDGQDEPGLPINQPGLNRPSEMPQYNSFSTGPSFPPAFYSGPAGDEHLRFPYYSYRRPWYTPGPASRNVNIVW